MKNPFKAYPTIFYQLIIISLLAQISIFIFTYSSPGIYSNHVKQDFIGIQYPHLLPFVSGFAFIIGGLISDKIKNIRYGFNIGAIGILIGITLNYLGVLGIFTNNFLAHSGFSIIYILTIKHIAILFPIANDWKDNAFLILIISPLFVGFFAFFILSIFVDLFNLGSWLPEDSAIYILNFTIVILLLLFNSLFKNIGYNIEEEEDDREENRFVKIVMTVLIIVGAMFVFNVQYLPFLYNPSVHGRVVSDVVPMDYYVENFLLIAVVIILVIVLLFRPTFKSRQFSKMNILLWTFLGFAILEIIARGAQSVSIDNMLQHGYNLIYSLFIVPIFLSVMTHVNLNKNLGAWLGLFFSIPVIFPALINLPTDEKINKNITLYAPYVALVLLIVLILSFRENRIAFEEKLRLEVSNHGDEEEEDNGIDILEHFVEK